MTYLENRLVYLRNNLDYLTELLTNENRDTIDTSDEYLNYRKNEVLIEIIQTENKIIRE